MNTNTNANVMPFFEISNDENKVLIQANEIGKMSGNYTVLPENQKTTQQWTHLASDMVKGVSGIQGKTLELIFSPETQQMLDAGTATLKKTVDSTATVARNAQGKIVEHGRIVNAGKLKQLASGGFQLLSIAVAQSHLADISKSLDRISGKIDELNQKWDNNVKGRLIGSVHHLLSIAERIEYLDEPTLLAQEEKNELESIIREFRQTDISLKEDLDFYINQIISLSSKDTFGASKTYDALCECVGNIEKIKNLYDLLLKLAFTANYIKNKISPTMAVHLALKVDTESWSSLFGKALRTIAQKSDDFLEEVTFSSNENLMQWKSDISCRTSQIHVDLHSMQKAFKASVKRHITQQDQFPALNEEMRFAISFDGNGEVEQIGILNKEIIPA